MISALVEEDCRGDVKDVPVNFASLGKRLGTFYWPSGKERHTVA